MIFAMRLKRKIIVSHYVGCFCPSSLASRLPENYFAYLFLFGCGYAELGSFTAKLFGRYLCEARCIYYSVYPIFKEWNGWLRMA
jgi:hypothetical protein